jgi:hypothetical protein
MKTITENPTALTSSTDGSGRREFLIEASSEGEARRILRQTKNIAAGRQVRNAYGEVLDPRSRYEHPRITAQTPTLTGGRLGLWRAVCRYSIPAAGESRGEEGAGGGGGGVPVAELQWSRSEQQQPLEKDAEGRLIANSKGEPYEPQPVQVVAGRVLTVTWSLPAPVDLDFFFSFDQTTNAVPWTIAGRWTVPRHKAKCAGIDPVEPVSGEGLARLVGTFEFKTLADETWKTIELLDYTVEDGKRVLLNGEGEELPDFATEAPDSAVFNTFTHPIKAKDFNRLEI